MAALSVSEPELPHLLEIKNAPLLELLRTKCAAEGTTRAVSSKLPDEALITLQPRCFCLPSHAQFLFFFWLVELP